MAGKNAVVPVNRVENLIVIIRGQKVMLDKDLARLYGVETRVLNQAVSRNLKRFPTDFMFRIARQELSDLISQNVISSLKDWGGTRTLPRAFTEQGVAMLSSILKSDRAINVNISIMRAFVSLRQFAVDHTELGRKLNALEKKYDAQFKVVFRAIRELMKPPTAKQKRIGF
jgi:hypothetical protein